MDEAGFFVKKKESTSSQFGPGAFLPPARLLLNRSESRTDILFLSVNLDDPSEAQSMPLLLTSISTRVTHEVNSMLEEVPALVRMPEAPSLDLLGFVNRLTS